MGDANLDGRVDAQDLNVLGINWRRTGDCLRWSNGDFNSDRFVDAADLNVVGINWRKGVAAAARTPRAPLAAQGLAVDAALADAETRLLDSPEKVRSTEMVLRRTYEKSNKPSRYQRKEMIRRHQESDAIGRSTQSRGAIPIDKDSLEFIWANW